MTGHGVRRVTRREVRRIGWLAVAGVVAPVAVAGATAAPSTTAEPDSTTVVIDDTGLVALSVPTSWVDVSTAATDFGSGTSPSVLASPDNESLVNSFDVSGVLVTVPLTPAPHDELLGTFGLTEGCGSLITQPFADSTLTGIIQLGDDCGGSGAVWRTIIGDTAGGQTVVAQGQAPSALGLPELNAVLASVVVADPAVAKSPQSATAGTVTPMVDLIDATASIGVRVPAAWADVELTPFDFDTGAGQPYLLASTDRAMFFDTFDAPGLGVTIPNWDATHEELLDDFGLQDGCATIEVVPYEDGTLTGLMQRGSVCGSTTAEWRAIVGDTADGLAIVVIGQASTVAGLSELEAAIGSIAIVAEFGAEDVVSTVTAPTVTAADGPGSTVAVPTTAVATGATSFDEVFGAAPAGFVRIVDDTGRLTMLAPETWAWVDTYELDIDDGKPRIIATSDLGAFQGDGDVGGALLIAEAYTADAQALVADFRRDESCATNSEQAYEDAANRGWMWIGEQCGPSGTGTWAVIVASPDDQSVTLRLHLRAAAGEDELAEQVLSTFAVLEPGTIAPAALPARVLPAGASPTEIATAFVEALAGGDGAAACSLLDPGRTGNVGVSVRSCADRLATFYDPAVVALVEIVGESTTSEECSASDSTDPSATDASVEFALGAERGCIAMIREVGGEWGIEDYSGSVLRGD